MSDSQVAMVKITIVSAKIGRSRRPLCWKCSPANWFSFRGHFRCQRGELFCLAHQHWAEAGWRLIERTQRPRFDRVLSAIRPGSEQLCLQAVRSDEVAFPILEKAAMLESVVGVIDAKTVMVKYPEAAIEVARTQFGRA